MKRFTQYFSSGLLFLVPVVVTLYVVYIVFVKIDGLFRFRVPGLGILVTVAIITLIGFAASNIFTKWITRLVDYLFRRLPLIKLIYSSIKDLIGAFVGEKKGFNKPVTVRISADSTVSVMGFVTCESMSAFGLEDFVAVYLPQSYNFAGNMIVVPKEHVTPITSDSADVMTFIISGGISSKTG